MRNVPPNRWRGALIACPGAGVFVAIHLLVGVLITVAIAWVLLATVDLSIVAAQGRGWYGGAPAEWPAPLSTGVRCGLGVRLIEQEHAPLYDTGPGILSPGPRASDTLAVTMRASVLECGWPWPALRSRQWSEETIQSGKAAVRESLWAAGLPVRWRDLPTGAAGGPRLPIQPAWPGFALDTALIALISAVLWRGRWVVRWLYRRRCGLCPACGYAVGAVTVCSECGGAVRPWIPARPPRRSSHRWHRRIAVVCGLASVIALAFYAASGGWGIYAKAPGGWYAAAWHGQLALGRSDHPFQQLGVEVRRFAAPYSLRFHWQTELIGRRLSLPLWLPLPALAAVALGAWWRAAVRRGLALHWPPPETQRPRPPNAT